MSKAKTNLFNFSSLFVDESENDAEPNFKPRQTYGPPVGKGYVVYQTSLPVLPIHYVNQQNGRHANNGRQATHRIIFPSSTASTGATPYSTPSQQRNRVRAEMSHHGPAPSATPTSSYSLKRPSDPYNLPPPPPPAPPASPSSTWKPMYPLTTSNVELNNYPAGSVKGVSPSINRSPISMAQAVNNQEINEDNDDEPFRQEKMNPSRFKRQANGANGEDEVESICKTQMQFISPKVALNDRAEWKYIVNLGERDPRLKQIIKVDVCS